MQAISYDDVLMGLELKTDEEYDGMGWATPNLHERETRDQRSRRLTFDSMPPEICPNCGAEISPNAKVCPECGSCEETGWGEKAHADNLGLPDEDFDYDDFVKREFGDKKPVPRGLGWFWWLVALILLVVFAALALR